MLANPVSPVIPFFKAIKIIDSDTPAPEDADTLIIKKDVRSNVLKLLTNTGTQEIVTTGGGGSLTFEKLALIGDDAKTFDVQDEAKNSVFVVDTVDGKVNVIGDLDVTGTLSAVASSISVFDNSLIKFSDGQDSTDAYDQGWYGQYNAGAGVRYRGCIYDTTDGYFKFFNNLVTEPDGTSALTASGSISADAINCNNVSTTAIDSSLIQNDDGTFRIQSDGSTTGIIISQDGKTIGINKAPSAGQALDINGGNVFINEGYLDIRRNVNSDNFMGIGNPNTGTSSRSTVYVGAGTSLSRFGQMSNTYVGDVGAGNAYYRCDAGRLHLQSNSTTNGLIIANSGLNFGFGEAYESTSGMISMRRDGTTNNTLLMINKDAYAAELGLIGVAGNSWAGTIAGDFTLRGTSGRKMYIGVAGTSPTVINTNGDIGIRTASPQKSLHVFTTTSGDGMRLQVNSSSSTAFTRLEFWGTSERSSLYSRGDQKRLYLSAEEGTYIPDGPLWVTRGTNTETFINVTNTSNGSSARSSIFMRSNSSNNPFQLYQNSAANNTGVGSNGAEISNMAGLLYIQNLGTTNTGLILSDDGKRLGINKVPNTAGQALDIAGGSVIINEGYLGVQYNQNNDNYALILNTNGGASAKSSLYIRANTTADLRIYQNSPLNTSGVGANNADMYNGAGRMHLQGLGTTNTGIIISQDGKTVGINKLPSAGQALDISGAMTVSGYSTLTGNSSAYTPVFSDPGGDISVAAPTSVAFNWIRIGNIVQVGGIVTLSTGGGAANAVSFEFSLPFNHTNTGNSVQGVANVQISSTILSGEILQSANAGRALCRVRTEIGGSIGAIASFAVRMVFMYNAV